MRSKECVFRSQNVPFNLPVPQSIPTGNEQMNVLLHINIFCINLQKKLVKKMTEI